MTSPWPPPPPAPAAPPGPPAVVTAAAVVTWVGTSAAVVFTVLTASLFGPLVATLLEAFGSGTATSWGWVIGSVGVVLALSGAAAVCAFQVLRARSWARWLLLALSSVTAVLGVLMFSLVVPLALAAAGIAVVVLLLVPEARSWFRGVSPG